MDYAAHLLNQAQHLARMTATPFARDHAKLRIEELVASHPMYQGLPAMVREERLKLRTEAARGN